jgi:glycosyltransferase involved in cell wall biosynthesis
MESELVSILVPNYNKANYLRETLDSVLNQTYTNWECIVVDDHSTDDSCEIIEEYAARDSRFRMYKRPSNRKSGGNAARNYAFEISKGEYINWLDSDDIIDSEFLTEKLSMFRLDPNYDFVLGNISSFENDIKNANPIKGLNLSLKDINYPLESLKGGFWVQTSLPLFKKEFLLTLDNLFDERILRGQEAEFFVRIFLKEPVFEFSNKSILYWRIHDTSKTSNFQNSTIRKQESEDYLSRKQSFLAFKRSNKIDGEVKSFFIEIFQNKMAYMEMNIRNYMNLVSFVWKHKIFKSKSVFFKVILFRIFKSKRNINQQLVRSN